MADWEIKMMVEHGIDFIMHYWNRPQSSVGKPVKKPFLGEALADGYFNAQYSDKLKFAICYYYGDIADIEDFKNNIMPYLIEYYLTDHRYMIIDNRPVIAFLDFSQLQRNLGGTEKVKEMLTYIRKQVKELGFDDAYILTSTFGDPEIGEINRAGFDYIFKYNWTQIYSNDNVAQMYGHLVYRDMFGARNFLASPSLGWAPEPWGGGNMGGRLSAPQMGKLFSSLKANYIQKSHSDSMVSRMVMLGNWNEIGEGHYFIPTETYGYSILEEIRKAFGGTHKPVNSILTVEQKNRIGILYPQNRVINRTVKQEPGLDRATTIVKKWNFNSAEGWIRGFFPTAQVNASGGYFTLVAPSGDYRPSMMSIDHLGIDINDVKYIVIRIRGQKENLSGHLLFKTDSMTHFDWGQGYSFLRLYEASQEYTDYIVDVWKPDLFKGTLNQLHLTFFSDTIVDVDYIKLLK